MTKYQLALIDFFTKDGRKPVFIEHSYNINANTPLEDILYTYNEMACRGYLQQERGHFLENAYRYSQKASFNFLYPDVILDVPFELHPYVVAMQQAFKDGIAWNDPRWIEINKLKDY